MAPKITMIWLQLHLQSRRLRSADLVGRSGSRLIIKKFVYIFKYIFSLKTMTVGVMKAHFSEVLGQRW